MFSYLFVLLLLYCSIVDGQLSIYAFNNSTRKPLNDSSLDYNDWSLFSRSYANIDTIFGYLHHPIPRNACSYIPPVSTSGPWFALIDDYPSCVEDMIINVRAAGYQMIIASIPHDAATKDLPQSVFSSGYPVVLVESYYADYLVNITSNLTDPLPSIGIVVSTSLTLSLFTVVAGFVSCCLCSCFTISMACCVKKRRSRLREQSELLRNRHTNYHQVQQRERFARQELIESILRQLQDLQVDVRTQIPLGADETNRLPLRAYHNGANNGDRCAICVEEFIEGESLRWLPCQHSFHPQCIGEWLTNHSSLCPLCKSPVPRSQEVGVATPLLEHGQRSLYDSV